MAAKSKLGGSRKAPLGTGSPHATRKGRGRTDAAATPLAVHTQGVPIRAPLEQYLHAKLGARLGRYTNHIERVTARFEDINGPRGGIDTECRVKVVLVSRPTVLVSARGRDARRAFDAVLDSVTRAVGRDLERAGFSERGSSLRAARSGAKQVEPRGAESEPEPKPRGPKRPSRRSSRGTPEGIRSGIGLQKRARARTVSGKAKAQAAAARGRGTR